MRAQIASVSRGKSTTKVPVELTCRMLRPCRIWFATEFSNTQICINLCDHLPDSLWICSKSNWLSARGRSVS